MRPARMARRRGTARCLAILLALGACTAEPVGPDAPFGRTPEGPPVDEIAVGHRLLAAGEGELALRAFYRAAAREGLTAEVLSSLGTANLSLGRLGQAERLLRRATAEDPNFAPAWNNLGVVLAERGRDGEAARVFETAFALDSGRTAEIRDNLAGALARLNAPEYARPERADFALIRRGRGEYLIRAAR